MCEEKKRLLQLYEQLGQAFGQTLTALNQRAGTLSKQDYEALRYGVDLARIEAERARLALEAHTAEHKC